MVRGRKRSRTACSDVAWLRGCGEMKTLLMALDSRAPNNTVEAVSKVA
jgi:hypothetical protein